ncbi:MAG: HEAT repeat domain-containing protein [Planctomycetota bacterium]|nr:HEAT repeat domain-containing protein [Planctomycetota bacterium]MDA1113341.1 HEAT repeat domain-containing protein [Planctomycetota bacterium]
MLPHLLALALAVVPTATATAQQSTPVAADSLEQQLDHFQQLRRTQGAKVEEAVACLHSIGQLGSEEAVDTLLRLVPNLEGPMQLAAVHAIALNETEYAHDKLRILARDRTHPNVRRQACVDLAKGNEEDLFYLRDSRLNKEKDLRIRGEILRNLIDLDVPKLDNAILKAAKSKDKVYASVGVYGIGKLHLERGLRTVEDYLTSPDLRLRLESFRALSTFGGEESFHTLLAAYAHANNLALRPDIEALLESATTIPEVNVLIQSGLTHENPEVVGACANALSIAAVRQPDLAAPALLKLLDHKNARIRDYAIEGLVRAHPDKVVEILLTQLGHDDPRTRTTAAWALSQIGDLPAELAPQLILLASDSRYAIRLHVATALSQFQESNQAFQACLQLLQDTQWSVRSAAVASLLLFRRVESVGPLVDRVDTEIGRVQDDAVEALRQLTGEDFGPARSIWRKWFKDLPEDYILPASEVASERLARRRERQAKGHDSIVTSVYHGVQVPKGGVIFVMDISGSMMEPFADGESFYQHFSNALIETISLLDEETRFNIILFSGGVQPWKEELLAGTPENAQDARSFLEDVRPDGPTNLYAALMTALGFEEVQTIFLLTDGDPTFGRVVLPDAILVELERANRDRKVVINTIAAGEVRAEFLAELATSNGGAAVDLTDSAKQD